MENSLPLWYNVHTEKHKAIPHNFRKAPQLSLCGVAISRGVIPMDVQVGDILTMKKPHPCGSKQWKVLRTGMDFKLSCTGCGHEVMLPRSKDEKNIRSIEREGKTIC